jgi:dihydroorotase
MSRFVIRGGTVIDRNGSRSVDVVVDGETGCVDEVLATDSPASELPELDAAGCLVTPGLVDLGVHVRQPGDEAAETVDTAAGAAALGGYTAIVALPDTDPCIDNAAVVSELVALAKAAPCDVVPAAAVTVGRAGSSLAPLAELVEAGVRVLTDADSSLADPVVLRHALEYLDGINQMFGVRAVIANRSELVALAEGGVMNEGEWTSRLGMPGRPAAAEEVQVARDLAVAKLAGTPIHLCQLSTAGSVALVRAAKEGGQIVTADVSPHHLVLDETACRSFDTNAKLLPPLRTAADRDALLAGVLDGTIDAIATNHAPWTVDAKERPFDDAPFGAIGLETTVGSLLTDLDVDLEQLLPALAWQPAAIAGLADSHGGPIEAGRAANMTVIDPRETWMVDPAKMASRSVNTPYRGRELTGKVRHTILAGRPTVVDGQRTDERHDQQGVSR